MINITIKTENIKNIQKRMLPIKLANVSNCESPNSLNIQYPGRNKDAAMVAIINNTGDINIKNIYPRIVIHIENFLPIIIFLILL